MCLNGIHLQRKGVLCVEVCSNKLKQDCAVCVCEMVYVLPLPANVNELKQRITIALETVTQEMLHGVWEELDYRLDVCQVTGGAHIDPFSPAKTTFHAELCNPVTRQAIELKSCSNPLRIQQVL